MSSPKSLVTLWNQLNSPLLRLPPEIRDIIYGYAVGGHNITVVSYHDGSKLRFHFYDTAEPGTSSQRLMGWELVAIPSTCRQIRHESESLLFKLNSFRGLRIGLVEFVDCIGFEKADYIRCIRDDIMRDRIPRRRNNAKVLRRLKGLKFMTIRWFNTADDSRFFRNVTSGLEYLLEYNEVEHIDARIIAQNSSLLPADWQSMKLGSVAYEDYKARYRSREALYES